MQQMQDGNNPIFSMWAGIRSAIPGGARSAHVMNAGKHLFMERHKKAQHTVSFKCELCRKTLVERRNLVCHQASAHK